MLCVDFSAIANRMNLLASSRIRSEPIVLGQCERQRKGFVVKRKEWKGKESRLRTKGLFIGAIYSQCTLVVSLSVYLMFSHMLGLFTILAQKSKS